MNSFEIYKKYIKKMEGNNEIIDKIDIICNLAYFKDPKWFSRLYFLFFFVLKVREIDRSVEAKFNLCIWKRRTMEELISNFSKTLAPICNHLQNSCDALKQSMDRRPIPLGEHYLYPFLPFIFSFLFSHAATDGILMKILYNHCIIN